MAYVAPSTRTTGTLITAAIWNQDLVDNAIALYSGARAIASQSALDFIFAVTATQLKTFNAVAGQSPRINAAGNDWEFANPFSTVWPIGSVFIAVVSTNPNTLLGFGTWAAFGAGRTIVALDSGQTEFDTVEETGGAKTVTLATTDIPSHNHTQDSHNHTQNAHTHTQDAHAHNIVGNVHDHNFEVGGDGTTASIISQGGATDGLANINIEGAVSGATIDNQTATNQVQTATNQANTASNNTSGSGTAHTNLQPYIVVYMWKRTA